MFIDDDIVALVTPYNEYGQVDLASLHQYVEYMKQHTPFTRYMVISSTGDQQALQLSDKVLIMHELVKRHQDSKFIFGVSYPSSRMVKELIMNLKDVAPYPAIMLGIPPYILPNQAEMKAYIDEMAPLIPSEILLYNNARRTGVNIEPATIKQAFKDHPNIKALKEAGNNKREDLDVPFVYTGLDVEMIDQNVDSCCGAIGSILPYTSFYFIKKGRIHSEDFEVQYRSVLTTLSAIGLVKAIKYVLYTRKIIASYETMRPMYPCNEQEIRQIDTILPILLLLEEQAKQYISQLKENV